MENCVVRKAKNGELEKIIRTANAAFLFSGLTDAICFNQPYEFQQLRDKPIKKRCFIIAAFFC